MQDSASGSVLESLQVTGSSERTPEAEDPYFAGRLAATSVILLRNGRLREARMLGQWSVNLVGKHGWDKMVDIHESAPRDDNDNGEWMARMLGEVDIHLRHIDSGMVMQLRELVLDLQIKGIIPREEDDQA